MRLLYFVLFTTILLQANPADNNGNGIPDSWENDLNSTNLPSIPQTPIYQNQIEIDLDTQYSKIEAYQTPLSNSYNETECDVSNFWDSSRVTIGGRAGGNGQDVCKVQLRGSDNYDLNFLTKWPINNIYYPLTPQPAWARFRFPIPKGHIAEEIEYELSWYKLFGSKPTNCYPDDINDSTGECILDVSSGWRDDVDAGVYLLWTTPSANTQIMTGPHPPIEKIGYSGVDRFKVKVPNEYRDVEELVVSLVTFNQYTKGCEKDNPTRCTKHANENFAIHSVTIKTEKPFTPPQTPPQTHPRILGSNSEFRDYFKPFDNLSCINSVRDNDWGMVFNAKNIWDKNTKGVALCRDSVPDLLTEVKDTQYYINHQDSDKWNRKKALRVMFLLRNSMDCYSSNLGGCIYSLDDINSLKEAFISSEMQRFDNIKWDYGYKCFDIGTEPPMKFWSIFVDTFWNDLNSSAKEKIDNKLSDKIGCYLNQVEAKDWSIFNGNNWTPILDKGALYWAIAYYYEDSRANSVVRDVLSTLWLHRDFYLEDGSYKEGIVEYTNVSYSNLREINNLMRQSFNQYLKSVRWQRIEKTSNWYLNFMVSDGKMADFGDSWDKRGWSTFDPLNMLLWQEMIGEKAIGEVNPNSCKVYDFFSNVWFAKGFEDPWSVQPSMARDWYSIVNECNKSTTNRTQQILFDQAKSGVLKTYIPNSSPISNSSDSLRFSQANSTWLGFNGVPNDFPHRELDFGALIWSAYGNRLLYDFGYGEIAKTAQKRPYLIRDGDTKLWDNLALGANTLVVEDATQSDYTGGNYHNDTINSSQIYGARGELKEFDLNGSRAFVADGSRVYGKEDSDFGWLDFFYRYLIALDDGNFIIVDSFKTKSNRGSADIKEYWYSASEEDNITECRYSYESVDLKLENPKKLYLKPKCSMLQREANSSVEGRIIANSLKEGRFELDPNKIVYRNRIGKNIVRNRAKYSSTKPVEQDIRLFLLQASPNSSLPNASISTNLCDMITPCFDIKVDNFNKRLSFKKDSDGNFIIDSFAKKIDTPIRYINLRAGWNMIGLNANLSLDDIKKQIGEDNLLEIRDESGNILNSFQRDRGYWIKVARATTISYRPINYTDIESINLKQGWNFIHPLGVMSLDNIIAQIGYNNLEIIQGEDKTYQKRYIEHNLAFLNDFEEFKDNKGYWIKVKNSTKLEFDFSKPHYYSSSLTANEQKELSQKIVQMQKPNEIRVNPLTPNTIEVSFIPKFTKDGFKRLPLDINATKNIMNFSINSIHPTATGLKRRVLYAPIVKNDLRILERVYLQLPFDLEDNHNYRLEIDSNLTGTKHILNFIYRQDRVSTIVHLDPEGYLVDDTKKAYMGMQLGSLGEIIPTDLSFIVKKADTQEIVYRGVGTVEKSEGWRENFTNLDNLYKHVVEFDFSNLTTEGEYVIESPIAGVSQPFTIGKDVYRKTLNTLALGLYNQRRGEDIVLPYSRHTRLATIEDNIYIYKSDDLDPFITNDPDFNGIKYPTDNEGKKVSFESAGHMDAGDYSIYTYNSSQFTWLLLAGLDLFGDKLAHDNLGIPQSGDGIPDIYQEMLIDLKWLIGMQDDDGGVFGMSKPKGISYQSGMTGADKSLERYLTPKDTPHTASFTAVMARAGRSKIVQKYNPNLANICRQKAIKAWDWLEKNSGYDGWHHYGAREQDKDDRVWASIELYALTGEQKYLDYFVANHKPTLRDDGVEWFNHGYGYANRVVAMWDKEQIPYPLDNSIKETSIKRYHDILDHYIELADITPYDVILEGAKKRWNQVGWYFPISAYGYDLIIGHYLYNDKRYLDLAKEQIHFTLGANPNNKSFITGIGNSQIQSLVDQKSRYDTIEQPVNGLPVSPIVTGMGWLNIYSKNISKYTYPATTYDFSDGEAYGLIDESYDGWNVSAEFTIEKLGAMVVTLAYITDIENSVYPYPKFNLTTTQIGNGKFKPILNFKQKAPKNGKIVWFANDVPISINPNFVLEQNFTNPTYKLGARFIDDKGRRWFDEVLINTRDYNNTNIPLEPFKSVSNSVVWHFDNTLKSDTNISLSFEGDARFDNSNIDWMRDKRGSAIRVENYGDGVKGSIFMQDIEDKKLEDVEAVTVEALIYPEKFFPRGAQNAYIIKFAQSWDAQLQLLRFTWDSVLKSRLSKNIVGEDGNISKALTPYQWHYIKMKIDRYKIYLYIDGKEIYNQDRVDINLNRLFDQRVINIYLGDFIGWIDEFRVEVKTDG